MVKSWNAEFAETLRGKYCLIQATSFDDQENVYAVEQVHGIVVDLHPVRGIWFSLKGERDGEDWFGPPDLAAFEKSPGTGEFTLSETGETISDIDYVIFWKFYDAHTRAGTE